MNFKKLKLVHIIGIGGCASSAIAELLLDNKIKVTGSEMKACTGLEYLEKKGAVIRYSHDKANLYSAEINSKSVPDLVLYSPAVVSLDPDNPELLEAKNKNIQLLSWQNFIGDFLSDLGKTGITVSGSEGKGTTAGILTMILKDTEYDPLSILGARLKKADGINDSNIYTGKGKAYILEADEFNRNFLNYHPSINIMINFEYDHPETYKNFNEYKKAFFEYFSGMKNDKVLIFRSSANIRSFVKEYGINRNNSITWFGKKEDLYDICGDDFYGISDHIINEEGNSFTLKSNSGSISIKIPALPGYMAYNATGAIIAALKLGIPPDIISKNILKFTGMQRRFDLYRTRNQGIFITDYGHSPESINHIIREIRSIFPGKNLHLIFQPHLFSRTYNFFNDFIEALAQSDKVSVIDIYPAREKEDDWKDKISSIMIYEKLLLKNKNVFYAGKSRDILKNVVSRIDEKDITCFLGAGDMDRYYPGVMEIFDAKN
jgi:UDP-N-acetylmuramate--alanine ligase